MQLSTGSVQKALPNVGQQEGLPDGNGPPNEAGSELRPGTSAQTELAKETFTGLCLWAQVMNTRPRDCVPATRIPTDQR